MRRATLLLFFLCLLALAPLSPAEVLDDFSVDTLRSGTFTLSEVLSRKSCVLINFFATWCPPCKAEFPHMQAAYEAFGDRVEIIAMSTEPNDTPEKLAEYADSLGLTFPIASSGDAGLISRFVDSSIPVTAVVDRFGNVVLEVTGAAPSAEPFMNLFEYLSGDSYTRSEYLSTFPMARCELQPPSAADAAQALEAPDGFVLSSPSDPFVWPMATAGEDGRVFLRSTNAAVPSRSEITASFTAGEGSALAFDFLTRSRSAASPLRIFLDGERVRCFSGDRDWDTCVLPVTAGDHTVTFSFALHLDSSGDYAAIDSLRLLTDAGAAVPLPALLPAAEELLLVPSGAREVVLDNPDGLFSRFFGDIRFFVAQDPACTLTVRLPEGHDAGAVTVYLPEEGTVSSLDAYAAGDGYDVPLPVLEDRTALVLYRDIEGALQGNALVQAWLYPSDAALDAFLEEMAGYGLTLKRKAG